MLGLGGLQLVFLGIVGEYIGRIYFETKRRPHFLVKECSDEPEQRVGAARPLEGRRLAPTAGPRLSE